MNEIGAAIHCQCGMIYLIHIADGKHIACCLSCKQRFPRIVVNWINALQGILSISLNGQNREEVVFSGKVEHLSFDYCCGNSSDVQKKTRILFRSDFQGIDDYIEKLGLRENHLLNGLYQAFTRDPRLRGVPSSVKDRYIRSVKNGSKPPVIKVRISI